MRQAGLQQREMSYNEFALLESNKAKVVVMSGFFEELKRRKVLPRRRPLMSLRAVSSFRIASAVFPGVGTPELEPALVDCSDSRRISHRADFSPWIFRHHTAGIERTSKVEAQTQAPPSHRRRNLILLAVAGLVISFAAGFFVLPRASARKIDKSIAVLPFENLSDEKRTPFSPTVFRTTY